MFSGGVAVSNMCEPLLGKGKVCGNGTTGSDTFLSICQPGLQCNGVSRQGAICTTENIGAPCSHNGNLNPSGRLRNDGRHCMHGLYCDLSELDGDAESRECELAEDNHGGTPSTATRVPPSGGTWQAYMIDADVDYFVITTPKSGTLSAHIPLKRGSSIYVLTGQISNENGFILASVTRQLIVGLEFSTDVEPGTYYIRVNSVNVSSINFGSIYSYSLTISFTPTQ